MIEIVFVPSRLEIRIRGHAGVGASGSDIVCAAVSVLFYTLGQALLEAREELSEEPIFVDKEGEGVISCVPRSEYEGNVARSYWTVMQGFILIADNYPDNVRLNIE